MFLLTRSLWKNKYYSKEEYKQYSFVRRYSYRFRLIFCIITSIFTILFDILFVIIEIIIWYVETLDEM